MLGALGSTTHCCRGEWSAGILCAGWDRGGGSVPGVVKALGLSTAHASPPSEGSESFSSKELAASAWRILASQAPAPLPTVIPRWEQARGRCSRLLPGWPRTRGMLGCTRRRRSAARRAMLAAALPPATRIQSPDGGRQLLGDQCLRCDLLSVPLHAGWFGCKPPGVLPMTPVAGGLQLGAEQGLFSQSESNLESPGVRP